MAGQIDGVGKGFFTEAGQLKSKDQLSKEAAVKSQTAADTVSVSSTGDKFSSSVRDIRGRFRDQSNSIAAVINQDESHLETADKAIKAQLAAAKELKAAFKSGDKSGIQAAQEKYEAATADRNKAAEETQQYNQEVAADRAKSLNVGNQQLGIVQTKRLQVEKSASAAPTSEREAREAIAQLKSDRDSIAAQQKAVASTKEDLQATVSKAEKSLADTESGTIRDLKKAESTAADLASRIVANGSQALAASNVSESIASQLLGA